MMPASGYHDRMTALHEMIVGAWTLEWGQLPDGRWGLDYFNSYNNERTRHYFDTEEEARMSAITFSRGRDLL